ncbi:MAG TPA: PaaI family thioesterase [Mycobacteriales bacterium]|jgi:uncharacterized protein (TIGR00369 family)|nr:PaaI family thioesterase [Mycobacteriales bacterium]
MTDPASPSQENVYFARLPETHLLHRLGMRWVQGPAGEAAVELALHADVVNGRGMLEGGLVAALVDVAAGQAAGQLLIPGAEYRTADVTIHYLRPIRVGPAWAVPHVRRAGRRRVVVGVDVLDHGADDALGAVATASFHVADEPADE